MKKTNETIVDDNGIEIIVGYEYEKSPSQIEEGHGLHEVGNMVYTELNYVDVVISGKAIPILNFLDDKQKKKIINLLNYEE